MHVSEVSFILSACAAGTLRSTRQNSLAFCCLPHKHVVHWISLLWWASRCLLELENTALYSCTVLTKEITNFKLLCSLHDPALTACYLQAVILYRVLWRNTTSYHNHNSFSGLQWQAPELALTVTFLKMLFLVSPLSYRCWHIWWSFDCVSWLLLQSSRVRPYTTAVCWLLAAIWI